MDEQPTKLSAAERAKRYRIKNKARVKENNKLRMRAVRVKDKTKCNKDPVKALAFRKKEAARKQSYRLRKKAELQEQLNNEPPGPSTPRDSFKSPQSFGKALSRSRKALPNSPRKQRAVISTLAKKVGLKIKIPFTKKPLDKNKDVQAAVIAFYTRPDIVYTSPGMKDEITIWRDGNKLKLRKYYMTMFIKEAHHIFIDENPEMEVGFSTFCKLRPDNVLLLHETPADQCKCLKCENAFLSLRSLKVTYDSKTFWETTLCDNAVNSKCWQGSCEDCSKGQQVCKLITEVEDKVVTWKVWVQKSESGKLKCLIKEGCIGEILSTFQDDFAALAQHINVKRIQASDFQNDKNTPNVRILQLDFAMNYSCEYQNEVQSALWTRGSVTLFTAATMIKDTPCRTYLICSDTKEKNTVRAFIQRLYEELDPSSNENKDLLEVIWTDGPSSEFKNRFMVLLLKELSAKFNKSFQWKYFATSHGKGVVDGIGGRAKSIVRSTVMSKKDGAPVVQTAEDFSKLAAELMPKTKVILFEEKDIVRDDRVWVAADKVPGIKKVHCLKIEYPETGLQMFYNALSPFIQQTQDVGLISSSEINQGTWVLVDYDGETYPGEVTKVVGTEYEVSVMVKSGSKHWRWPSIPDKIFYRLTNIVKKLDPPEVVTSRGHYEFAALNIP